MLQTVEPPVPGRSGHNGVVEYLLGLGDYAYRAEYEFSELYQRLHQVIHSLARSPIEDRELVVLRYGAQLNQVDRVLAALLVEGLRERLAATGPNWLRISEATYFRIAAVHGKLMDYVSYAGHFAVPTNYTHTDPSERYGLFIEHFRSLPNGPTRQGLRLAVLSLFERGEELASHGLALCNRLRGHDSSLDSMAAKRVLLAVERGEIVRYDPAYRDLSVQMVAAVGRWGVSQAMPHLHRLLEQTPPRDRDARVLRAHLQRAIEQLSVR